MSIPGTLNKVLQFLLIFAAASGLAMAQSDTAVLFGVVTDP